MSTKLNQILAIEKGTKSRVSRAVTDIYQAAQKPILFDGFTKDFRPKSEDGETFPSEKKEVQRRADQELKKIQKSLAELMDVTATKDWANCNAKADIIVDGQTLLANVPVTYILFLEKQLEHLGTIVNTIPTLDTSIRWTRDDNQGVFQSEIQTTHKTKKMQRPLVLLEPTKEHPGKAEVINEDVVIGHWDTVHFSGRMRTPEKEEIQERLVKLQQAVKQAREAANNAEAQKQVVGDTLLNFVFGTN